MKPDHQASRQWTIAAFPVAVGGLVILVGNDFDPIHWKGRIGYLLLVVALVMIVTARWTARRARQAFASHQRKLDRGHAIVQSLIAQGDRLFHQPYHEVPLEGEGGSWFLALSTGEPLSAVESWRTVIGNKLSRSPFRRGTSESVLTQEGNRISDPLRRLREIDANLEPWIEED